MVNIKTTFKWHGQHDQKIDYSIYQTLMTVLVSSLVNPFEEAYTSARERRTEDNKNCVWDKKDELQKNENLWIA